MDKQKTSSCIYEHSLVKGKENQEKKLKKTKKKLGTMSALIQIEIANLLSYLY